MASAESPPNQNLPILSIVIVNYNGGHELLSCLHSLEAVKEDVAFEVIVVDNGSTDGSLAEAERRCPAFRYLRAGTNLGFAKACNIGLGMARGRQFMLLNPDTEVLPGALTALVESLDSHSDWGIVGPMMVDHRHRPYSAARRFPTPFGLFCEATRLRSLFPRSRFWAGYLYGDRRLDELDEVDQIEGSALMISRAAREKVGDLDEQFFLFFEEVDWCRRVRHAGFEIHVVPGAVIQHHRSTTMSRHFVTISEIHADSAMKYFRKHHGASGLASLRRWMRAALWIRELGMTVAGVVGAGERARLRAEAARRARAIYQRGLSA